MMSQTIDKLSEGKKRWKRTEMKYLLEKCLVSGELLWRMTAHVNETARPQHSKPTRD
jgi:hypothetical protein